MTEPELIRAEQQAEVVCLPQFIGEPRYVGQVAADVRALVAEVRRLREELASQDSALAREQELLAELERHRVAHEDSPQTRNWREMSAEWQRQADELGLEVRRLREVSVYATHTSRCSAMAAVLNEWTTASGPQCTCGLLDAIGRTSHKPDESDVQEPEP